MQVLNRELEAAIEATLAQAQTEGLLPEFAIPSISVSPPKRAGQGDLSYPAMGLARHARMKPLELAQLIAQRLPALPFLERVEVAAPGFVNGYYAEGFLQAQVDEILAEGDRVFQLDIGAGKRAQVEFVSANPSGPITIGHTRNAVVGDAMARLLEAAGYTVQREYYYNNAGKQMLLLGQSLRLRYLQALGEAVSLPDDHYQGAYLVDIAAELAGEHGDALRDAPASSFRDIAERRMFAWIRRSLATIDIHHDAFFNETSLFESGQIWRTLAQLEGAGHIYRGALREGAGDAERAAAQAAQAQPATWFRSSRFGDEKDRVMVKSDGSPTYTLPDIAYHQNKLERGFDIAVIVLGSDHFTQADVVKYGIRALGMDPSPIRVIFIQMVRVLSWNATSEQHEIVKQSKRRGTFDTMDTVVALTSADAVRYHMLARSPKAQLDFDVDQVVKQANENPVYYIQNAYVRCAGIFREAESRGADDSGADLQRLGSAELGFLRKAMDMGSVIEQAVLHYEPHKIAFYAQELAAVFHPIYDKVRVFHSEVSPAQAKARLRFYRAAALLFRRLLHLMGMNAPERM